MSQSAAVDWPGERVETTALFGAPEPMEAAPVSVSVSVFESAFIPAPASQPLVTPGELWAALRAVGVLTAGAAVATCLVVLALFP